MSEFHCPYWSSFVPTRCEFLSKRSQVVGQLMWLLEKQLLNRDTNGFKLPSLLLSDLSHSLQRFSIQRTFFPLRESMVTWIFKSKLHLTACDYTCDYTSDYMWLDVSIHVTGCSWMWLHVSACVCMCQHRKLLNRFWIWMLFQLRWDLGTRLGCHSCRHNTPCTQTLTQFVFIPWNCGRPGETGTIVVWCGKSYLE